MIFLDWETFYDPKNKYSIKQSTAEHYIRDPRFEFVSISIAVDDDKPACYFADDAAWPDVIDWLRAEAPRHAVASHNAQFDMAILEWRCDAHPKFMVDTLAMARALGHYRCALGDLAAHYGLPAKLQALDKMKGVHVSQMTDELREEMREYNLHDTWLLRELWKRMSKGFPLSELKIIHLTTEMFTRPVVQLNAELLNHQLQDIIAERDAVLNEVGVTLKELRSPPKFAAALQAIGVNPPMKKSPADPEKFIYAFAKKDPALLELLNSEDSKVASLVEAKLGYQSSIRQSRIERFLGIAERSGTTPWIPVPLNYFGAQNTGRFSGGGKINLQNAPKGTDGIRAALVAPPGYKLIVADQSAIEARMLAWQAGQENSLEVFRKPGGDIYAHTATEVYGFVVTKSQFPTERNVGKVLVLGLGFQLGFAKFSAEIIKGFMGAAPIIFTETDVERLQVDVTAFEMNGFKQRQLNQYIETTGFYFPMSNMARLIHCAVVDHLVVAWRNSNSSIVAYWKTCEFMLKCMYEGVEAEFGAVRTEKNAIVLPNGLKLNYKNLTNEKKTYRYLSLKGPTYLTAGKLCENIIQSLSRITMTDAMIEVDRTLRRVTRMGFTVHDELVLVSRAQVAAEVLREVLRIMATSRAWYATLPLAAEGKVVDNYGEAK